MSPIRRTSRGPRIRHLAGAVHDPQNLSEDYVRGIRALELTRDEDAAPVIADFLDMPGPVGDEAVRALVSLARRCGGRVQQRVSEECFVRVVASLDDDEIRNAHRVLAALGSEASRRALAAPCWADAERDEARRLAA